MSEQDQFDLDEDIFCFEELEQERAGGCSQDSLDAIFASFQAEEDALAAEAQSAPEDREEELDGELPDLAFADDEPEVNTPAKAPKATPAQPAAQPAAQAAAPQPAAPIQSIAPAKQALSLGAFSKSALLILISVTLMNGMVGFVILRQSSSIMKDVSSTGSELLNTAKEIKQNTLEHTRASLKNGVPLPIWDVENHPTFELAGEDIEEGNFKEARKKLSTFLALIDGIDPEVREEMEARAKLLIASSIQLEAIALSMEENR